MAREMTLSEIQRYKQGLRRGMKPGAAMKAALDSNRSALKPASASEGGSKDKGGEGGKQKLTAKHKGGGYYDVMDAEGNVVSSALRKDAAEQLISGGQS